MLDIALWDLHAARALAARLRAGGVPAETIDVRGHRTEDGLQEAQVRGWRHMSMRWRMNVAVVIAAALLVGLPVGGSLGTLVLGEHVAAGTLGAVLGFLALAGAGLYSVWGDHLQRFEGSRNTSRVEGHVTVTGDRAVVRAEAVLAAEPQDGADIMTVQRRTAGES